ncbi:MAG: hypothetical protein DHS20C15_26440 [Planctomycetota bacterium]|nr:MAG: hypothetical protein DHS20C15_26440 [Planctomycetota bacterium]
MSSSQSLRPQRRKSRPERPVAALPQALIVDDDPDILRAVGLVLEKNGYEVHLASTGTEALSHFEHADVVDLLVTDLVLPHLDGLSLIANIRTERPDLPVIAMTGADQSDLRLLCAELEGAGSVLAKPFGTKDLLSAVDDALR